MKEASWNDCLEKNLAVKVSPNKERARSLIETAEERMGLIKEVNEKNCNYVFEDYYASLLELLQAITILAGYNINNPVCIGFYLKDVLKRQDIYIHFDDVRFKRNSLIYYGKRMDFATATKTIERCKDLITAINKEIKL